MKLQDEKWMFWGQNLVLTNNFKIETNTTKMYFRGFESE